MPTTLDKKFLPLTFRLIAKFGRDASFTVYGSESYTPGTGINQRGAASVHTTKVSPPQDYELREIDDDLVKVGDAKVYLAAKSLDFKPERGLEGTIKAGTGAGYLVNGAILAVTNVVVVDTGSGTIPAGEAVSFGADTRQYMAITDLAAGTFMIDPPLRAAVANNAVVVQGKRWRVQTVVEYHSGEQVALYELQLRGA